MWKDDREKIKIHQKAAISSTDQGSSDEEVGLIRPINKKKVPYAQTQRP